MRLPLNCCVSFRKLPLILRIRVGDIDVDILQTKFSMRNQATRSIVLDEFVEPIHEITVTILEFGINADGVQDPIQRLRAASQQIKKCQICVYIGDLNVILAAVRTNRDICQA